MGCCFSVLFCQLFRVLFFSSAALLLNQHPRQNNTRRDSRKRRKQRPFERISGLRHLSRQKINRHRIEDRLRTAHHDRSSQANQGIRPMIFKDIQYQSRGRGGGKHFNKHTDFVEGMVCVGGCVGGPSKHKSETEAKKARDLLIGQADSREVHENLRNLGASEVAMHRH